MVALPVFVAVDSMYVMPCAPLIDSSRGAITELRTAWALAPLYVVLTEIVGGARSGYCVIGRLIRPIRPKRTMNIDITVESTGRLINVSNRIFSIQILCMKGRKSVGCGSG